MAYFFSFLFGSHYSVSFRLYFGNFFFKIKCWIKTVLRNRNRKALIEIFTHNSHASVYLLIRVLDMVIWNLLYVYACGDDDEFFLTIKCFR